MYIIYRNQQAMIPLQETWEQADEAARGAILLAMHRMDQQLQNNPQEQGESRPGKVRILLEAPMAILYKVDDTKEVVTVLRAWVYANQARKLDPLE